jgi:hypothetical protein
MAEQLVGLLLFLKGPIELRVVDDAHFYEYLAYFLFS